MKFFSKKFDTNKFTLYPIGDLHLGSEQCDIDFVANVIDEIEGNRNARWIGMGDWMENALIGSKSDVYTQTMQPRDQMEYLVKLFYPIRKKGLFMIGGNHERRTTRATGLVPDEYIALQLGIPYMGFSCMANFQLNCHTPNTFTCYFHHNYGGGFFTGGKINRAEQLRRIAPVVDATFSAHFHVTSRIPVTWHEAGRKKVLKKTGYDYITGSSLKWDESYAEERAKPASSVEFIKVTFIGSTSGEGHGRTQVYEVITK
jgi:hypothetical protein